MWSLAGPDPPPLADLDGHGAADHVARREILHGWRIALHEPLALGVGEVAALAARALGDQAAGAVDPGRVELDEFHVLQRQSGPERHAVAIAGAGVRRGAGEIGAAIAAGRQHRGLRLEAVQCAIVELPGGDAEAAAFLVHDQVEGEVFDEELDRLGQRLAVHGVQHGVASAVGGGAGALDRRLAVVARHAAEGALIDLALRRAREGHAPVLQLVDRRRRVAGEVFDGVLVAQPVGALDRVVHVPAPVVRPHVAERGADAALGGDGVRAGGEELGDAGDLQPLLGAAESRPQPGAAGSDHHHVDAVVLEAVGCHAQAVGGAPSASLSTATRPSAAAPQATNRFASSSIVLVERRSI